MGSASRFIGLSVCSSRSQAKDHGERTVRRASGLIPHAPPSGVHENENHGNGGTLSTNGGAVAVAGHAALLMNVVSGLLLLVFIINLSKSTSVVPLQSWRTLSVPRTSRWSQPFRIA